MKWGLIARSETDRGIGIQTHAIWHNLRPDKTLVVIDQKSGFQPHPGNYPGASIVHLKHGNTKNTLPQAEIRDWWQGLDVVFTVETFYDWDLIEWAQADNVRTIVQGNPEFWMASNPQPDQWIWPTSWRIKHLPEGPIVPVPVPDVPFTAADPHDGLLRAVHIAGNRAMGDRNGTDILYDAMRSIPFGVKLSLYSQAPIPAMRNGVPKRPVENRWDMYKGQHVLVLPRRYGGLCLPTIEALASGCAVIMSQCEPNQHWPVILCDGDRDRVLRMQTGDVTTFRAYPNVLANHLKTLVGNRGMLEGLMVKSREWADANRWPTHEHRYYDVLDAVRSRR